MFLRVSIVQRTLLLVMFCIVGAACAPPVSEVTPTPDIALLETRTEAQLAARLTRIAPVPTPSPTPIAAPPTSLPTPRATVAPTPVQTAFAPPLVIVHRLPNETDNVVVPAWAGDESVLTHFTEPISIYSVRWTNDAARLVLVSSHDFAYSRSNERNVFVMRPDGAELRMITGEHLPPEAASGPFVTLEGRVDGAVGTCRVTAQGMGASVDTDESGRFLLDGVSQSAAWARAICQSDTVTYQGDVDLGAGNDWAAAVISVAPGGQGWREVSFSPDGQQFVGTFYRWRLDEQGEVVYEVRGVLYDIETGEYGTLQLPEGTAFHGAAWSTDGERILGGLSDEEAAFLWAWDTQGASVGELFRLDNPEDQILTIVRPVWSPDGAYIAFELQRWYWWSDQKFRTDLMSVDADGQNPVTLVESEWGWHATQASWGTSGASVVYQYYTSETDLGGIMPAEADIWSVTRESLAAVRWTEDGMSFLPAVRPVVDRLRTQ
jgi:hypothetical protein